MGNRYIADISLTPTAGNDVMVLIPASGRRARLVQVVVTGDGTTSAAQKLLLSRSSGGTTPGGATVGGTAPNAANKFIPAPPLMPPPNLISVTVIRCDLMQ